MSFAELIGVIWARKWTFSLVFVLILGSTIVFCVLATPIFQSGAVLMITPGRLQQTAHTEFPDTLRYQINSQVYVIESEQVLRQAIAKIGPETLFPKDTQRSETPVVVSGIDWFAPAMGRFFAQHLASIFRRDDNLADDDRALVKVRKRLSVTAEKDSQVVSVTFRHEDPKIAERFLRLVLDGYLQRQADLSGNAAAPSFFKQEAARYRDDYKTASAKLSEFAQQHSTFSISQEVKLALDRRDETTAALAKTRGAIAEKRAEAATLQNTLTQLRRRIALPAEIVGPKQVAPTSEDALTEANKVPANESPLLLVRVFQQTAQSLVNLNSEIVGLQALETSQNNSLSHVEKKLVALSSDEAEFSRLKSEVQEASDILEAHVQRTAEAQMNADQDVSEKLSRVKVVQTATKPLKPVYPPIPLLVTMGMAIGLLGGGAATVAQEAVTARRRQERPRRGPEPLDFPSSSLPRRPVTAYDFPVSRVTGL